MAEVDDKPEVKKAGGVYYTPTYIVDYIVEQTLGKLVEGKEAHEVAGRTKTTWKPAKRGRSLKVLDPACGSGSFLIGAWGGGGGWIGTATGTWITAPRTIRTASGGTRKSEWRLSTAERKRILAGSHLRGRHRYTGRGRSRNCPCC